jgi:hypothetical protein
MSLALGAVLIPQVGHAQTISTRLHPNEGFVGLVNGDVIKVACPGPTGQNGHPLAGQTLGLMVPVDPFPAAGNTGSRGRMVVAQFGTSTKPTVTFTHYGTEPIPTSLVVPCSGTTTVVFTPQPTSSTAHSFSLTVSYGNVAVTPSSKGGRHRH